MSEAGKRADDVYAYKPFVDGLRAISIIAVVGYHMGLPGVRGGFVGVDVFFVISGYLIINQIVTDLGAGRFSFAEFWMRRVLRILPPYLLVIAATLAIAPFVLMSPEEYGELGREAVQSAVMTINFFLYSKQGYFDAAAYTKPLLHLWSLAVEEQFYLVAPLLLAGIWALGRRLGRLKPFLWAVAIVLLAGASFVYCIRDASLEPDPTFYLTPYRAWEFILGGAIPLAVPLLRRGPGILADLAGIAGAALILAAIVLFSHKTSYPSYHAALPVIGACLVIIAGLARPETPVARLLAVSPLVWIGLVSYAWYLWHWPLMSFVRIANLGEPAPLWTAGAAILSLGLAAVTRYWVELPIKRWRKGRPRTAPHWRIFVSGGAAVTALALVALVFSDVIPKTIGRDDERMWPRMVSLTDSERCALIDARILHPDCFAQDPAQPIGLLIGNSHARMIYETAMETAAAAGTTLVSFMSAGCPTFYMPPRGGSNPRLGRRSSRNLRCRVRIANGFATLKRGLPKPPVYAILSSRWNSGAEMRERISLSAKAVLEDLGAAVPPPAEGIRDLVAIGVGRMIAKINELKVQRILIIGPLPELKYEAPPCVARADRYGFPRTDCAVTRASVDDRRRTTIATLRYLAEAFPDVRFVDPIDAFCDDQFCYPYDDSGVLYIDDDHLSRAGADKLFKALKTDLDWAMTGTEPAHAVDGVVPEAPRSPHA